MANGNELGKYYVQIVPTTEGISGQIESALNAGDTGAEKAGKNIGQKLASGFGTTVKAVGASVVAATSAAIAGTAKLISETAQYGDEIDKASQKIGISAEAYQEWDFIAEHSGTSMASLTSSFRTLSNAAQGASADQQAAFEKLGLSMDQVSQMSTEELFGAVINGLQQMEEGTERTALASDLLGRGAMELGALLNTSAEDTEAMRQQVHDLGGVMTNEAVKDAAAFQDALQNVKTAAAGVGRTFGGNFLPAITSAMDGLSLFLSGDTSGIEKLTEGIQAFASNLINLLPTLTAMVAPIMRGLLDAVIQNLPILLEVGVELVSKIIEMLPDFISTILGALPTLLPMIISSLISLVVQLVAHIPEIILSIVNAIPDIIVSVVDALLDNLPILIKGIIDLTIGVTKALPQILMSIWETLKRVFTSIFTHIKDFVQSDLFAPVREIAKKALNGLIGILNKAIDGINILLTPLRAVIAAVGKMFGASWSMGDVKIPHIPMLAEGGILRQGSALVGEKGPELLQVYGGQAKVTPLFGSGSTTNLGGVTINVYAAEGQDPRSIAEAVNEELQRAYSQRRAVFA